MRFGQSLILSFTLFCSITFGQQTSAPVAGQPKTPPPAPRVRIDEYRARAARIIGAALTSDHAYRRLAHLTDRIGHRLSGIEQFSTRH
jgi:hypothetical protein